MTSNVVGVAVGQGSNSIAYYDGTTWTASPNTNSIFSTAYGVAYNGNRWVAVGNPAANGSSIAYSDDGISWTPVQNPKLNLGNGVAWNGIRWIAVGTQLVSGGAIIAHSTDGETWIEASTTLTIGIGIACNGNTCIAVGEDTVNSKSIVRSSDGGLTWNAINTLLLDTFGKGVAFCGGQNWIVVGGGSGVDTVYSTDNGSNWDSYGKIFVSGVGGGVAWNGSKIVAVGANAPPSSLYIDYLGQAWTPGGSIGFSVGAYGVAWNHLDSKWYAVGSSSTGGNVISSSSDDGANWSASSYPFFASSVFGIAFLPPPVTSIFATGTINISQDATTQVISYTNGSSSGTISTSSPLTITNADTSSLLKVIFDTDITIGNNWYIICGTSNIQFGSTSLKQIDGTRPIIAIYSVSNYSGFIQNGTSGTNGNSNIYVYNIEIYGTNSQMDSGASTGGWVGQGYFGRGASNNYIVNCASQGPIVTGGGGIIGAYAGSSSGSLYIIGCSSSGDGGDYSGGIVGQYAGQNNGNVTCQYCWSTGDIYLSGGGIFGYSAGDSSGTTSAINCYSTGIIGVSPPLQPPIGQYAGGIFGRYAVGTATNCYSQGQVQDPDAGGIFGADADASAIPTNCYSSGTLATAANGIYGSNPADDNPIHCYVANGSGSWSDLNANNNLTGTPNPVVGNTWVSTGTNTPYILRNMGYTPYTIVNITTSPAPNLKMTYSQTVSPGLSSFPGVRQNLNYAILSGGHPSITIATDTGIISTTSSTPGGTYNIVVKNDGSYNITTFALTVSSPPTATSDICFPAGTPILTDQGNVPIEKINPKVHTIRNKKIESIVKTKLTDGYLVCFEKNSLGPNVPCARTLMSGNHKVVINGGKMVAAKEFLNTSPVSMKWDAPKLFTGVHKVIHNGEPMYNVLMEKYDVMLVNNMLCETLDPSNKMADLYTHLKHMSYDRQKRVIENFDSYNQAEKHQPNAPLPKPIRHFGLNAASPSRGSQLKIVYKVFR